MTKPNYFCYNLTGASSMRSLLFWDRGAKRRDPKQVKDAEKPSRLIWEFECSICGETHTGWLTHLRSAKEDVRFYGWQYRKKHGWTCPCFDKHSEQRIHPETYKLIPLPTALGEKPIKRIHQFNCSIQRGGADCGSQFESFHYRKTDAVKAALEAGWRKDKLLGWVCPCFFEQSFTGSI